MTKNHPLDPRARQALRRAQRTGQRPARCHRLHPMARAAATALTMIASTAAWADSGVGADTSLANALNPAGLSSARERDPDGLGEAPNSRTPTGLMYPAPYAVRETRPLGDGWRYSAALEAGGLLVRGDRDAARFREYKDLRSGLYLNNVWVEAEKPDAARYLELIGGGLGRHDQYFGLTSGRYNDWRLKVFYNETPHVFTSTYRSLWDGVGTGQLTLRSLPRAPVAPATAANTDLAIGNAVAATPFSSLGLVRHKGGLRLDLQLPGEWKAFVNLTSEHRTGARPFGMVFGGGGGAGNVEVPESIDHDTHDAVLGLSWNSPRTSLNLSASASVFRNNVGTMRVENPLFVAAANGQASTPYAEFDLYPDNTALSLKAEAAHAIPEWMRARLTGSVAITHNRQDDDLIPYSPNGPAVVNTIAGGSWDTTASLSRKTSGARIDSQLLDLGLALSPADSLDVRAKLRHHATDNGTEFWSCNPLTGQWGRLINGGSGGVFAVPNATAGVNPAGTLATAYNGAACDIERVRALGLVPSAGNVALRNIPFEQSQDNLSLAFDWRVASRQNLTAHLERETIHREHRERDRTREDRIKLGYVNRALAGGTLRLSAEQSRRRGSAYVADPYEEFLSASMGPLPTATGLNVTSWIHINDLHRKFDLADRDQRALQLRYNHALREDLDLSLALYLKDARYPDSAYGRNGHQRQNSLSIDLNWQPSPELAVSGFATHQAGRMAQSGLAQNACVIGNTYFFRSDGSVATVALTPAQIAAGITTVGSSTVTAANFLSLCGSASATSPLYPTSRTWRTTQDDVNSTLGANLRWDMGKARLDLGYTWTSGRVKTGYTFNPAALGLATSGGATPLQQAALALIGTGPSDLVVRTDVIDASVLLPISKNAAVRLLARHEKGKVRDWHYDGVIDHPAPTAAQQIYLDGGPQDYRSTMLGVMLQWTW